MISDNRNVVSRNRFLTQLDCSTEPFWKQGVCIKIPFSAIHSSFHEIPATKIRQFAELKLKATILLYQKITAPFY
jgi:hypothetical protein